jgi:hypothetical protein
MIERDDARKLVIGHSAGNLTPEERRALYQAAFEDQETFDQLMEEEAVRQAFEYPGQRERLLAVLDEQPQTFSSRVWAWFRQPAALGLASSLAAGLMIGVFVARQRQPQPDVEIYQEKSIDVQRLGAREAALASGAFSLPLQNNIGVKLTLDKTEYRRGEPIRLTFETSTDAYVLIIERKPDQDAMLLYPEGETSTIVQAGQTLTVPAEGPAGIHRVRLVAVSPDVDPLKTPPDWKKVDGTAGVAEVRYRVVR